MVKPFVVVVLAFAVITVVSPAMAGRLSQEDRQIYRQAFAAADRDQWTKAHSLAKGAKNHVLAKVLTWMAYTHPGSPGGSFSDITAFMKRNPDWPQPVTLARRAEEAIDPSESSKVVRAWFAERVPVTPDGKAALARVLLADGEDDEAIKLLRSAWIGDSFGTEQEKQFISLFSKYLRKEDHTARLDRLLWDRQVDSARRMMKRVDTGHQRLALARIALMEMDGGAEGALRKIPAELANDPGLLFDRARWRRKKGRFDDAIALVSGAASNKVRPDMWWAERIILARESLQQGNVSKAYELARKHGKITGPALVDAEWFSGWVALRWLRDRSVALGHFKRAYEAAVTPISRSRGAYWAGRAAEELGDSAESEKWYRAAAVYLTAYYGQLAAGHLSGGHKWELPPDPVPTQEDVDVFNRNEMAEAAGMLMEIDAVDHARSFIFRLVELAKTPGQHALIARVARRSGHPDLGVAMARRSAQAGVILVAAGYPVIDVPVGEPPEKPLVMSIIRQESNFHQEALSGAGARGLMQLLPATAKQMAHSLKMHFSVGNLTADPEFNMTLGAAYLGQLLDSFGGSYIQTIAAYNAGPARSRQWTREFGDPRESLNFAIDWIESIPFGETRNYVQRVLEGVQIYRRRLGSPEFVTSLESDLKR